MNTDGIQRPRARPPGHPGGILARQYLEPLGIGMTQAARAFGVSRKTLSKIVHERGAVTPAMALRLAHALRTTPEFWLNLQRTYDLWKAAQHPGPWRATEPLVVLTAPDRDCG